MFLGSGFVSSCAAARACFFRWPPPPPPPPPLSRSVLPSARGVPVAPAPAGCPSPIAASSAISPARDSILGAISSLRRRGSAAHNSRPSSSDAAARDSEAVPSTTAACRLPPTPRSTETSTHQPSLDAISRWVQRGGVHRCASHSAASPAHGPERSKSARSALTTRVPPCAQHAGSTARLTSCRKPFLLVCEPRWVDE